MRRSDFHYELPPELIAQQPPATRSASRMLCLDQPLRDARVTDLPGELAAGDLLVFNDTRVIPARLHGAKDSGGRVEVLVERLLDDATALAQVRASKPPQPGTLLRIDGSDAQLRVEGRDGEFYRLRRDGGSMLDLLDAAGHTPLPPYIDRPDAVADRERYQTLFAREPGAVAAPTAGLHFDESLLGAIRARGVELGFVTLHVGAGTFQPVRVDDLSQHKMHRERFTVSAQLCEQVAQTRARGRRVVAVGTTVVRTLESVAAQGGQGAGRATFGRKPIGSADGALSALEPHAGETDIFITPGFRFRVVDALLTNFHLPESTLLMLVSAFAGRERVLAAYAHAVRERYRFFSYGDAMFIPRRIAA